MTSRDKDTSGRGTSLHKRASGATESKYTFLAYRRGAEMIMTLAVRAPNKPGSTGFRLVGGGRFSEAVSLDRPADVIPAIRRAFAGTLGGRINPLKKTGGGGRSRASKTGGQ